MRRFGIRIIVSLLACMLAGCSLLYSYGNIDRYIRWSLDDYVTWDHVQETQLRERLSAQLNWHKQTQLPRYRSWLETTGRALDNDVDLEQLKAFSDQLQLFWQDAAVHLYPDIEAQLASLSDDQAGELIGVVREKQADLKSEYDDMTMDELVRKRKRDMTKTAKYWLGALDSKQAALIDSWARNLPDGRTPWLEHRQRWTDAFAQALQHRREPAVFGAQMHPLFVLTEESETADFRKFTERNRDYTLQLLADLHNSRTPKQRDVEKKRIAQWLENLDQLAAN